MHKTLCKNCVPKGFELPSGSPVVQCPCGNLKPLSNELLQQASREKQNANNK
jgi:hypothetical protein